MTYRGVDISIQKRERPRGEGRKTFVRLGLHLLCCGCGMRHLHAERGKSVEDPKFLFNRFFFHKKKEEEVIHFPSQSPIRIEALRKNFLTFFSQ